MSTEEEREFQLEMLKVQIKHQTIWSSLTLLIAVEFAAFTSLAATFLSFGLTSGNNFYIFVAISSLICLYIVARGTIHYFQSKKIEMVLDENLEKEIQSIRDKFISKKTEQKETKEERSKEEPKTSSQIAEYRVLNEAVWRRGRCSLIVNSIVVSTTLAIVTFAISNRNDLGRNFFLDLPNAGFVPLVSLILIVMAYLLWWTSKKLDNICYIRIHELEDELGIRGNQWVHEQIRDKTWFLFRGYIWHSVFLLFIGAYLFTAYWLFTHTVIT